MDGKKCQGFSELQRTIVGISQQQETLKQEVTQNPSEVFIIKSYSYSNLTLKKIPSERSLCSRTNCSLVSLDDNVHEGWKNNKNRDRRGPQSKVTHAGTPNWSHHLSVRKEDRK